MRNKNNNSFKFFFQQLLFQHLILSLNCNANAKNRHGICDASAVNKRELQQRVVGRFLGSSASNIYVSLYVLNVI